MYGFNKGLPIGLIYVAYGFISQLYIQMRELRMQEAA